MKVFVGIIFLISLSVHSQECRDLFVLTSSTTKSQTSSRGSGRWSKAALVPGQIAKNATFSYDKPILNENVNSLIRERFEKLESSLQEAKEYYQDDWRNVGHDVLDMVITILNNDSAVRQAEGFTTMFEKFNQAKQSARNYAEKVEALSELANQLSPNEFDSKVVKSLVALNRVLHDEQNWVRYYQRLFMDAIHWIEKNGSEAEISSVRFEGQVSQRSILAVITQRGLDRGEPVSTTKKSDFKIPIISLFEFRDFTTEEKNEIKKANDLFFEAVKNGLIIDNANEFTSHGIISHMIQMDYIAPTLRMYYGDNLAKFYFIVTKNRKVWNSFFEDEVLSPSSPYIINQVFGRVLPL